MKLRKGQASYKLPPIGQLLHVVIDAGKAGGVRYVVQEINYKDYCETAKANGKKYEGRPALFAIEAGKIYLAPKPDAAYEMRVRFFPPIEEV